MSTMQEYWDACLIRAWRHHMKVIDAMNMFYSITGKRIDECELLRTPHEDTPWSIGARFFAAGYLPKISDRLWEQEPEKDVGLLRKLSKSKYNTEKTQYRTNADRELANAQAKNRRDREKKEYTTRAIADRNSATDWGVVKGPAKTRMRRK